MVIVDVTDKDNPQHIADLSYTNFSYTHQGWITDDFKYYILGDEADEIDFGFNTKTIILDISDLDNPSHSFDYTGPTLATDHNGYIKEDVFYLANNAAGLRVIDISEIETGTITQLGYFDSHPLNDFAGYEGIWSTYPYFESGNIVISDREGFFLVKSSALSTINTTSESFEVALNSKTDILNIQSSEIPILNIKIYDLNGKKLTDQLFNSKSTVAINLNSFSNGIYILYINNLFASKVVKF